MELKFKCLLMSVVTMSAISIYGCDSDNDKSEEIQATAYTHLDLSGAASLVFASEESASGVMSASNYSATNSAGSTIRNILYKVSEDGSLEAVKFVDEEGNETEVVYRPDCAKNINEDFVAMYSSQQLPLKFLASSNDGVTLGSSEITHSAAMLLVRKSDGKIFPLKAGATRLYPNSAGEHVLVPVCDPVTTSSDMWTLPQDTVLVTGILDESVGTTSYLLNLKKEGNLEARTYLLPGDGVGPYQVTISPNAIAYGSRVIGDDSAGIGRLISGTELEILSSGVGENIRLPDGLNYRRFLERQYTEEFREPDRCSNLHESQKEAFNCDEEWVRTYTGFDEVVTEYSLTSDSRVVEQEVYRSIYSAGYEPSAANWGLVFRYPGMDLFLGESCNWYQYEEGLAKKLALVDSVIPADLIASYGAEQITCSAIKSDIPNTGIGKDNYYDFSGYMSFELLVNVDGASSRRLLVQYNPVTGDRLTGEPEAAVSGRYAEYSINSYPYGKGLYQGQAYNDNGDQIFLIYNIEDGTITESARKPNASSYYYLSPVN